MELELPSVLVVMSAVDTAHQVTGYINKLEERTKISTPRFSYVVGAHTPERDFTWMRLIADKCGAVLMCYPTHISRLVTTTECCSPFDHCDVVRSTNKNLTGPRGGKMFFRRGKKFKEEDCSFFLKEMKMNCDFEDMINFVVFHSMQLYQEDPMAIILLLWL